ncbi:hypothetical protein F5051DRAFT_446146 [Lentinula edodes]|nr:hypothetical protein F5051DRAFT_446146 [Lentinula edodes]
MSISTAKDIYQPSSPSESIIPPCKRVHNELDPESQAAGLRPPVRSSFITAKEFNKALVNNGAISDNVTSQEYVTMLMESTKEDLDEGMNSDESHDVDSYSTDQAQVVETLTMEEYTDLREMESRMLEKQEHVQSIDTEPDDNSENFREKALEDQYLAMENEALRYQVERLRESESELQKTVIEQKQILAHVVSMPDSCQANISEINRLRHQLKLTTEDLEASHSTAEIQAEELLSAQKKVRKQEAKLATYNQALAQHNKLRQMVGMVLWDYESYPADRVLEDMNPLIQRMKGLGEYSKAEK